MPPTPGPPGTKPPTPPVPGTAPSEKRRNEWQLSILSPWVHLSKMTRKYFPLNVPPSPPPSQSQKMQLNAEFGCHWSEILGACLTPSEAALQDTLTVSILSNDVALSSVQSPSLALPCPFFVTADKVGWRKMLKMGYRITSPGRAS